MKNYLFALALLGIVGGATATTISPVNAASEKEYIYGENIIPNGDFKVGGGEYLIPGNAPSEGVVAGMGTFDANKAIATREEGNESNTVLKFSGDGFGSIFKLLSIKSGSTYEISFDFKVDGTTDNIGFAFWSPSQGNRLPETNIMDANATGVTISDLTNGWKQAKVTRLFDASQTFDSMHFWCNITSATIYVDNIKMNVVGSEDNIFTGGDFEGFLDYGVSDVSSTPDSDGIYGTSAKLGNHCVQLQNNATYGAVISGLKEKLYTLEVKYSSTLSSDAKLVLNVLDENNESLKTIDVIKDGTLVNEKSQFDGIASAKKVQLEYAGSNELLVSYFSIKATYENAFDPSKTYYESKNYVVNGDFEKFDEGTTFSKNQLEGAWGSVSLDNPGHIVKDGENKVAAIGKINDKDSKNYSSMFLMTPDDITIGDLIRFQYDYKLTISDANDSYMEINSCFVGGANQSYYKIDLSKHGFDKTYNATSGVEAAHYNFKSENLDNGYTRVTLDFQVSSDKIQWNSVRWLFTPHNVGDSLYVDNVAIKFLSETPFEKNVETVKINSEDFEMYVGEEKQLEVNVSPEDAQNKDIVWKSSDESVATVENGKVIALKEGVVEITAEASNGVKDSVVVTVLANKNNNNGCGGSIIATSGLLAALSIAGIVLVGTKKKEEK